MPAWLADFSVKVSATVSFFRVACRTCRKSSMCALPVIVNYTYFGHVGLIETQIHLEVLHVTWMYFRSD